MNHRLLHLTLLAVLPVATCRLALQAQDMTVCKAPAPRGVLDYLELLPTEYTGLARDKTFEPKVVVLDKANDYLKTAPEDEGRPSFTMALFRRSGRVTVALRSDWPDDTDFDLLRYENGHWIDMTEDLVPGYSRDNRRDNIYEIPRRGTTIRVFDNLNKDQHGSPASQGRHLYDLIWRNGKFVVRR